MANEELMHLWPTMAMLAEALTREGIACRGSAAGDAALRGARAFLPGRAAEPGVAYVLKPGDDPRFPGDRQGAAFGPLTPAGALIRCPECPPEALLDALLAIFDACRDIEARLDGLVYRNAGLDALCELGASLMDNPICIHDDWFVMVAQSAELTEVMPPDYIMTSSKAFIPRIIVEDFKYDSDYLETYAHRTAQLWNASPGRPPCLYANLWEGSVYRGRLLVVKHHRDFLKRDYLLTELLAQRAMSLLGRKRLGLDRPHRSMDDIVYDLLLGRRDDPKERQQLAGMLGWSREAPLVCARMRSQQPGTDTVMEHALHSDLFRTFPRGYIMLAEGQQCVIVNADQEGASLAELRHRLAPLCRDYCLYAGLSLPVRGLEELRIAYRQAEIALDQAFQLRGARWIIPFDDCALEYLLGLARADMPLNRLVAPELARLMAFDAQRDTRYFETLRTYLLQERDIPRTAKALIIHRTTLLYRLKKIQEITGLDLDDPWRRLYLMLSLRILETEDGL